tara:strand:+ start:137 stop:865 length:729 start_codon:yes stop_codon:yes gene_type:complete
MEKVTRSPSDVRSELGPFAIVPEWVIDAEISHGALRLYALIARYTNSDQTAWPSRGTLADRLRVSKDTVDRYLKELVCISALAIEHRRETTKDGNMMNRSNLYTLLVSQPDVAASVRPPSGNDAARGSRTDAAQNYSQLEPELRNDLFDQFWNAYGKKTGKKKAKEHWKKEVKDEITANLAIRKAAEQAAVTEPQYRKDPERWIRDHRWDDEIVSAEQPLKGSGATIARLRDVVDKEGLLND